MYLVGLYIYSKFVLAISVGELVQRSVVLPNIMHTAKTNINIETTLPGQK